MDQRSFQRLLRRTVALPVALLVILAAVLAIEILLLSISLRWVDHSDQVISTARQLQRQVIQMETGLRGYYLTGDQSFLESYNDAKSKVPEQVESLVSMTSDNPLQQQRLKQLQQVNERWIQWADGEMLGGHHNPSSGDLLAGQALMTESRQKQRDFVSAEESLRSVRSARTKALNDTIVGSAVGLSLMIAFLLFSLTRHELLALSSTYERHLQAEEEQKQQLKESREWLQITLKSLGEAVVSTDKAGKVSFINPAAQGLTGWDEPGAIGRPFGEVVRLSDERSRSQVADPIEAVRRAQHVMGFSNSLMLTSHAGKEYPVELTGAPILKDSGELLGVVVVFRDVTQRRQTEQSLRSSERLNLAGRLSATIAHEIRNPLDTVSNLIHLLRYQQKPDPTSANYLQMAGEEVARIAQITSQLLTFHREARHPVEVNLTEVLESVLVLFAPQIKQNHIMVERHLDPTHSVRGFPGELRQVFSNLVGNAVEAMSGGGRLVLHARESTLASDSERRGVRVTILDDGPGIPPAVRRNLFAPFYTTKGEKGTGLGLWVSRGILEKHEGTIHLSSAVGSKRRGTAFSVFLPFEQKLGMLDTKPAPPVA